MCRCANAFNNNELAERSVHVSMCRLIVIMPVMHEATCEINHFQRMISPSIYIPSTIS